MRTLSHLNRAALAVALSLTLAACGGGAGGDPGGGATGSAPVLSAIAPLTVVEQVAVSFQAKATDADGDPLQYTITGLPAGATFDAASHIFNWTPRRGQAGDHTVSVTVSAADGSDTVVVTITVTPALAVGFIGDVLLLPNGAIGLVEDTLSGDTVTLRLDMEAIATPITGAAFDLSFNPLVLSFLGASPGPMLGQNADVVARTALAPTGDRILVGLSQLAGSGVTGSGTLLTLTFQAINTGDSPLTFANEALTGPGGAPLAGGTWFGGTATGS